MVKSILNTEPGICYWCRRQTETALHHVIPNNPRRRMCTQDGLVVFLCPACHDAVHANPNTGIDLKLKQIAELRWIDHYSNNVEDFIKRYGRNYLDD